MVNFKGAPFNDFVLFWIFLQLLHNHRLTMAESNICLVAFPTLDVHEIGVGIRRFNLFAFLRLASLGGAYLGPRVECYDDNI